MNKPQQSADSTIGQKKRTILSQIQSVKSDLENYTEQKRQLEDRIPKPSVSIFPIQVVACVLVLIAAIAIGSETNEFFVGAMAAAMGLWVIAAIGESYEKSSIEKQKRQIGNKYASQLTQKAEVEQLITARDATLRGLNDQYSALVKRQRSWWTSLDGWSFEKEVAKVFQSSGYTANVTSGSNDGGIDINLYRGSERIVVQCKNYKSAVGPAPVRDLFGVLTSVKAHGAIMVSQTSYTKGAVQFAYDHGIKLMTLDDIIKMHEGARSI